MAHVGRTVKNVEAPRPLKTQLRVPIKSNLMLIEELIQLIENVALALQSGDRSTEPTSALVENLRVHGPQLESVSKDTLDRAFVAFRNASQDERLNIMTRLHLLELIELRAKGWEDSGFNSYYKTKHVEIPEVLQHPDLGQAPFLSTSPTYVGNIGLTEVVAGGSSPQQLLLGPGELIRNSGKFAKPTKIPGKTYCKDEVVIRNADSGKVMGIKGRRVHMIEELSETIISFQRVNPGAKERLVQITGPTEEKINYAKQLIGDTIRRNASPVRLDATGAAATGGSCSSLASSNSDEATPRAAAPAGAGNNHTANRHNLNANNRFANSAAVGGATHAALQQAALSALINSSLSKIDVKTMAHNPQLLLHSYSASDATLGEYKYTVNVGQHVIKITGNCCDLVKVAKLVLDDYFSSAEFLASVEAGAAIDGSLTPPLVDSGINLNMMPGSKVASSGATDGDDDVFADANGGAATTSNGVVRSRRSHFSRLDSTPDAASDAAHAKGANENGKSGMSFRITYEHQHLLYFAKSPHSWVFPLEWQEICEKAPAIVRNKDLTDESNRFNGDKYLMQPKSCDSGHLVATSEESLNEGDTQENE